MYAHPEIAKNHSSRSLTMTAVTNSKIVDMTPSWAPFAGFSVLFDNPGNAIQLVDGAQMLHCVAEPGGPLDLYARLDAALGNLGSDAQARNVGFCPLPPNAYHVTVWDGINVANLALVTPELQQEWSAFLQSLPGSLAAPPASLNCVLRSALLTRPQSTIHFRFEALRIWGNQVLVAELAAADEISLRNLSQCASDRSLLAESALHALGESASPEFTPHVSLGYFANQEGGRLAQDRLPQWCSLFQDRLAGASISFDSLTVYGFTDMTHFYRMSPQDRKPT